MAGQTTDAQDVGDKVVARIGSLENRVMGRLNSNSEVRIVGVEMSFGELFRIFFEAMPAYLLALFVWMMLIGVAFAIVMAVFGIGLLGILG